MGIGTLVKNAAGKLKRNQQRTINAEFTDVSGGGNGGNAQGIRALALHPDAGSLLQSYYGIDLTAIPAMDENQLGDLVDFLKQSEWMDTHLDKLKEHFTKYINRQVNFNQFVAEVTKSGIKGAEGIDKAGLDTYLAVKGYTQNSKKLQHKANVNEQLLAADLENYIQLEDHSLQASLRSMALKLASAKQQIDLRPDKAAAIQELNLQIKADKERIGNLITYGTKGAALRGGNGGTATATTTASSGGGGGGNIWEGLKNWFNGK
ncbi:hypothetical protein G7B40_001495 [Aetokthonos hydrillicola Thurmond2011]|jgi:hypothetical protein|uniref:Uncharacterized protein n=1 Tax=Aetokthonos hydrillicola Thurmond2011 TaxID=2712845 RepID=A0AAP5I218_9CYAN|nr:hypothetical protein [Aetokthonos hydrillicola]MBO3464136.1 hypothetical protein [Aetokthonos hydrillicola CCALA 1050]MBW4591077.1 hypothetical protein [Aetokthonos hydrillicola CCALA 1050]MDR9893260.1 hypothetical protein [Aetokthonos hydrillicola Thurmond2011]